jgi:hypothetical protein
MIVKENSNNNNFHLSDFYKRFVITKFAVNVYNIKFSLFLHIWCFLFLCNFVLDPILNYFFYLFN